MLWPAVQEQHRRGVGRARLGIVDAQPSRVRPAMLQNKQLSGGLVMFFFKYLAQAGLFFVVTLYLSVCLGLSALATGVSTRFVISSG